MQNLTHTKYLCGKQTIGAGYRGKGFLGDIEKYNAAAIEGITVLRTTPSQLYTQGVADVVRWFENQEI